MTLVNPHVAIRASAGSGKTFQLSNRLLTLLFSEVGPDRILATTFTRKAAGEILERVLVRLAQAADDAQSCGRLGEHLQLPKLRSERALVLLQNVLAQLHRLRICTMDAFFANIAGAFAAELRLPAGWKIVEELDDARLRAEAVRAVLRRGRAGDLVELLRLLTRGETSRSVARQIREVVDGIYTVYRETQESAWRPFEPPPQLDAGALQHAIEALADAPLPPNKNWSKRVESDLCAARAGDWFAFVDSTLACSAENGGETYYRIPIIDAVRAPYRALFAHARAVLMKEAADRTYATYQLLAQFDVEYTALKNARRALRFDDLAYQLSRAAVGTLDTGPTDIFFRLDQRADHILLDEFQDTSKVQWTVLAPLAEEVVASAEERSFFCVGDVKQAIYGWRGGSAELFDQLDRRLPGLEWRTLATSYRSAQPVVDLVNRVFTDLDANPVLCKAPEYQRAGRLWSQGFAKHTTARKESSGYVCFVTASRAEDGNLAKDAVYAAAADRIQALTRQAPNCTIGVLTRKNAGVGRMMEELRSRKTAASQEGGNLLGDCTAVQLLMALLKVADHPGDSAARFFVANSPLGPVVGMAAEAADDETCRAAAAIRRRLLYEGYGPTLADWGDVLSPHVGSRDRLRLQQLAELAYGYDREATLRPTDFIEVVEHRKVEEPTLAPVRVMTLHQAKGLEFDVVVLPELDEQLVGQTPPIVTWEEEPAGSTVGVLRYVREPVQTLLPPEIRQAFTDRVERTVRESLCLLYVALTRAARAVVVVVAPSAKNEQSLPRTFTGVLRGACGAEKPIPPDALWFECGDPQWYLKDSPTRLS